VHWSEREEEGETRALIAAALDVQGSSFAGSLITATTFSRILLAFFQRLFSPSAADESRIN